MPDIEGDLWYWYHSISEPYYHIQLTIKYRKALLNTKTEKIVGEFWTDGYYFATVSGRGDRNVIEKYIEKQGRAEDVRQLRLFEL